MSTEKAGRKTTKKDSEKLTGIDNWPHFRILSAARFFLLEYVLMLVGVLVLLWVANYMIAVTVDYFAGGSMHILFSQLGYRSSLGAIAAAVVVLPVTGILYWRVHKTQDDHQKYSSAGGRRFFLYGFLLILFASLVFAIGKFVYDLLDAVLQVGIRDDGVSLWALMVKDLCMIAIFKFTLIVFYADRQTPVQRKQFITVISGLLVMLLIMLAAFPLTSQRNVYIDNAIEQDLRIISQEIAQYAQDKGRMPNDLSDIDLKDDIRQRVQRFGYEYRENSRTRYELCAVFREDTTNEEDNLLLPLNTDISFSSRPALLGGVDMSRHRAGRDCFDLSAYVRTFAPSSDSFEDLFDTGVEEPAELMLERNI